MSYTVQKWGHSLAVRILHKVHGKSEPRSRGTEVEVEVRAGEVVIRPKKLRKHYKLSELLAKCKGPNPHREAWAKPMGKELI